MKLIFALIFLLPAGGGFAAPLAASDSKKAEKPPRARPKKNGHFLKGGLNVRRQRLNRLKRLKRLRELNQREASIKPIASLRQNWSSLAGRMVEASVEGSSQDILDILEKEGKPKWRDEETGMGLLHFAAENHSPGAAQALLSAGALPRAKDKNGDTPLHIAARYKGVSPDFVAALLRAGANPRSRNKEGETPLVLAAQGPNAAFLKAFKGEGGRLNPAEWSYALIFKCMDIFMP